jgi:hypothetical protein
LEEIFRRSKVTNKEVDKDLVIYNNEEGATNFYIELLLTTEAEEGEAALIVGVLGAV